MNRASIYQLALQRLGNYEYEEGSPPALACERVYPFVLQIAQVRGDWSFCRVRKRTPGGKAVDYGGGRLLYPLPRGCLKVKRVLTYDGGSRIKDPDLVAQGITVGDDGADGITLDYQGDLVSVAGELPERNPAFCDGVIALLAARVALNITGKADLAAALEQEAARCFSDAIAADKQQSWSNDKDPMTNIRRWGMFRRYY